MKASTGFDGVPGGACSPTLVDVPADGASVELDPTSLEGPLEAGIKPDAGPAGPADANEFGVSLNPADASAGTRTGAFGALPVGCCGATGWDAAGTGAASGGAAEAADSTEVSLLR